MVHVRHERRCRVSAGAVAIVRAALACLRLSLDARGVYEPFAINGSATASIVGRLTDAELPLPPTIESWRIMALILIVVAGMEFAHAITPAQAKAFVSQATAARAP